MAEYLLFDAARAGENLQQAVQLNKANVSLYKDSFLHNVPQVAPHLFALPNAEFAQWFIASGWGKSWGVLVETSVGFEECRNHFLKFLKVKTEDGVQHFFRFYDPRVLRLFLPTCSPEQLKEFFGPVEYFIVEDADAGSVLLYSLRNGQLATLKVTASEFFATRLGIGDVPGGEVNNTQQPEKEPAPQVTVEPKKKRRFFIDE